MTEYFFFAMIQKLIYLFHTIQYEESEENKMGTIIGEGITFDDVLLVPQYSEVTYIEQDPFPFAVILPFLDTTATLLSDVAYRNSDI